MAKGKTYVSPHPNFSIYVDGQEFKFEYGYLYTEDDKLIKALDNYRRYGVRYFSEDDYDIILKSVEGKHGDNMKKKAFQAQRDKSIALESENERMKAELDEMKKSKPGKKPNES